jgi:putative DNA primase/helicase
LALRARGLWGTAGTDRETALGGENRCVADAERSRAERTEAALAIWNDASPAPGTPAQDYLAKRGLQLSTPSSLRFHPRLKHPTGGIWPGMVALVTRGGDRMPVAIHRTFLARDGSAKAPVEPAKMMLGPCRGGAVRLSAHSSVLMVGEGIETCLAALQATGHPAWAALSTSGLRSLELPDEVNEVVVLADGDEPGEAAARSCALRWSRKDRRVRIARPPRGMDFNDLLLRDSLLSEDRRP